MPVSSANAPPRVTDPQSDPLVRLDRILSTGTLPAADELVRLQQDLLPFAKEREVRLVVTQVLDAAGMLVLAAQWDSHWDAVDGTTALRRVERWLQIGLPRLARWAASALALDDAALGALAAALRDAEAQDNSERAPILAANLEALAQQDPSASELIAATPDTHVAFAGDPSGIVVCSQGRPDRFLLGDNDAATTMIEKLPAEGDVAFSGLGDTVALLRLSVHQRRIVKRGLDTEYSLHLIEPDVGKVRALLDTHDLSDALRLGRLRLHVGTDAEASLARALQRPRTALPTLCLGPDVQARALWDRQLRAAVVARTAEVAALNQALEERNEIRRQRLANYLAGNDHLRWVLLSSRSTTFLRHGIASVAQTLREQGHAVFVVEEQDELERLSERDVTRACVDFDADAVFAINWVRTPRGPKAPLPFLTWDMDGLPFVLPALREGKIDAHDHLMLMNTSRVTLAGWPKAAAHQAPTPLRVDVIEAATKLSPRPEHIADVGYIGGYKGSPEQALAGLTADLKTRKSPELLTQRLNRAFERLVAHREPTLPTQQELGFMQGLDPKQDSDPVWRALSGLFIAFTQNVMIPHYRYLVLQRLLEGGVDLALFGYGWEQHPKLAGCARGVLEGPEELARGYLSTRIALQVMGYNSLHQRLSDGLSIGAGVLFLRQPLDYMGRVRALYREHGELRAPEGMTKRQLQQLNSLLPHVPRRQASEEHYVMHHTGVATDEVYDPSALDPISAADVSGLMERIRWSREHPDAHAAALGVLRENALDRLHPRAVLRGVVDAMCKVERDAATDG